MKRNTITLLIILGIIAALHFIFLYIFMSSGGGDTVEPPKEGVPEPSIVFPEKKNLQNPGESVRTPGKARTSGVKRAAVLSFDYTGTVHGAVKGVPVDNARNGILFDPISGRVLWAKSPREAMPIASLTKMMTLLLAIERLDSDSNINLDTPVEVSRNAINVKPTRAGLLAGERIPLELLLKAMIVKSANDAAEVTAEFFGGGKREEFIRMMNERAARLNMKSAVFFNPHGLPGKAAKLDNMGSCEDMGRLGMELMRYPLAREWVAIRSFKFRDGEAKGGPVELYSHNYLLNPRVCPGGNGIKTGFTSRAGFCVAASCERDGKTLIAVLAGSPSSKERNLLAAKLFDWGFARLGKAGR